MVRGLIRSTAFPAHAEKQKKKQRLSWATTDTHPTTRFMLDRSAIAAGHLGLRRAAPHDRK